MRWLNRLSNDMKITAGTLLIGAATVGAATQTSETGPILAFVGALIVAFIAAREARRGQREQLEHDREMRLAEMAHERQSRDIDHMRGFLDDAIGMLNAHREATRELRRASARDDGEWFADAREAYLASRLKTGEWARRLDLRLPNRHPVRETYWAAYKAINRARDELPSSVRDVPADAAALKSFDSRIVSSMANFALFHGAAQLYIGAQLAEGDDTRKLTKGIDGMLAKAQADADEASSQERGSAPDGPDPPGGLPPPTREGAPSD